MQTSVRNLESNAEAGNLAAASSSTPSRALEREESLLIDLQDEIERLKEFLVEVKTEARHKKIANLKLQVENGIKELETEAKHINLLSDRLKKEIIKFNQTASTVNEVYRVLQQQIVSPQLANSKHNPKAIGWQNLCEVRDLVLPIVIKRGSQFVLTLKRLTKP